MIKLVLYFSWQILVLWLAIHAGFALQVIEKADVLIGDAGLCQTLELPSSNGHCRFTAKAEGNLDKTWTYTALNGSGVSFTREGFGAMLYDPKAWRMKGGVLAVAALCLIVLVLSGLPPGVELWRRSRRRHQAAPS